MKKTLAKKFEKAINDYVSEFEKRFDVEVENIDSVGHNYEFMGVHCYFYDLKYVIDNNLSLNSLISYNDYFFEHYQTHPINFENYVKKRIEFKYKAGMSFKEIDFQNSLLEAIK